MSRKRIISLVVMVAVSFAIFSILVKSKLDGKFAAIFTVDRIPIQAEYLQGVKAADFVDNIMWIIVALFVISSIGLTLLDYLKFRRLKQIEGET